MRDQCLRPGKWVKGAIESGLFWAGLLARRNVKPALRRALVKGRWTPCPGAQRQIQQDVLPVVLPSVPLGTHTTLSGINHVPHFKDEGIQILLPGSLHLIEMPGAQEYCWSYLVLCPESPDPYTVCRSSMNICGMNARMRR